VEGTLSYYFDLEHTREIAEAAGFIVRELEYATVINRNRKAGSNVDEDGGPSSASMKRVFVHAVLQNSLG